MKKIWSKKNKTTFKFAIIGILAYIFCSVYWNGMTGENGKKGLPEIQYSNWSEFKENALANKFDSIDIEGHTIFGFEGKNKRQAAKIPGPEFAANELKGIKTPTTFYKREGTVTSQDIFSIIFTLVVQILPLFLLYFFIARKSGGMANLGKSDANVISTEQKEKLNKLDDLCLDQTTRKEIEEIIGWMNNKEKLLDIGGRVPKGVLLSGGPGLGKTAIAKAIARETNAHFMETSGSSFIHMLVGSGARNVSNMVEEAKKNSPCVIFIDEIDTIGRKRGNSATGGNQEQESTLNELLRQMDGFNSSESTILFVGATNRPEILDPALVRGGRFEKNVQVSSPNVEQREKIFKIHTKAKKISQDINWENIAKNTFGFSGADIENMCNEAAIMALRGNRTEINHDDLMNARNRIIMGIARPDACIDDRDKWTTAIHEAGHTIAIIDTKHTDDLEATTIMPHGGALGVTLSRPIKEHVMYRKNQLLEQIAILYAGRVAEEIMFGTENIGNGASGDIQHASTLARNMVLRWGFGTKTGWIIGNENESIRDYIIDPKNVHEDIKEIVGIGEKRAREIVNDHKKSLIEIAQKLMDKETITAEESIEIFNKNKNL